MGRQRKEYWAFWLTLFAVLYAVMQMVDKIQ